MKAHFPVVLFPLALFLGGCIPSERAWWSPDGSRAVVVANGEARLVDAGGAILDGGGLPDEGARSGLVESVSWMPGGREFLAHRIFVFGSWESARSRFDPADVSRIEELAPSLPLLLRASVALGGDADHFDALLRRLDSAESERIRNALFLALETDRSAVEGALGDAPRARASLNEYLPEARGFVLHRIDRVGLRNGDAFGEVAVVERSAAGFVRILPAPGGDRLAFGVRAGEDSLVDLRIRVLDSGKTETVAKNIFPAFDWAPDGGELFAIAPLTKREGLLRQVQRVRLDRRRGENVEILATALIPFSPRVETLSDGSILFAGQQGTLPATRFEDLPGASLFRLRPETGDLRRVATSEGALPVNLGYFVASPGGNRVAVVESDTDAVAVVDLESGEVTIVSPPSPHGKCRTMPAWRSDSELTFAVLDEESGRVEWMLWSREGGRRVLSRTWDGGATEGWIEKEDPDDSSRKKES